MKFVDAMVAEFLWRSEPNKNILFDGFPRTIEQAEFLDEFFVELDRQLDAVIYLKIADQAVEKRLVGRVICNQCTAPYHIDFKPPISPGICDVCNGELAPRVEDFHEMIQVRLRAFHRALEPVLEYYKESERLVVIDGEAPYHIVKQDILDSVAKIQSGNWGAPHPSTTMSNAIKDASVRMISHTEVIHDGVNIVLVGGPGSGKGTQAEKLQAHLSLPHISTGDLFRENLHNKTSLGDLARSYMDKGALVPDDVTEAMVEERLVRPDALAGFILDGFPRTLTQAYALTEIMNTAKRRISKVIFIRVSDQEIVERLAGRLICRDCQTPYHIKFNPPKVENICNHCNSQLYQRDDDNPKTIRSRLKTFHQQTGPILNYYRGAGVLVEIDGEGAVSSVIERTIAVANQLIDQRQ